MYDLSWYFWADTACSVLLKPTKPICLDCPSLRHDTTAQCHHKDGVGPARRPAARCRAAGRTPPGDGGGGCDPPYTPGLQDFDVCNLALVAEEVLQPGLGNVFGEVLDAQSRRGCSCRLVGPSAAACMVLFASACHTRLQSPCRAQAAEVVLGYRCALSKRRDTSMHVDRLVARCFVEQKRATIDSTCNWWISSNTRRPSKSYGAA